MATAFFHKIEESWQFIIMMEFLVVFDLICITIRNGLPWNSSIELSFKIYLLVLPTELLMFLPDYIIEMDAVLRMFPDAAELIFY